MTDDDAEWRLSDLSSDLSSLAAAPTGSPSLVRACRRWRSCFGWAYCPPPVPVAARWRADCVTAEQAANRCAPVDRALPPGVPDWLVPVPRPPVCGAQLQADGPYRQGFGPHRLRPRHRRRKVRAAAGFARPVARAGAVPAAALRAGLVVARASWRASWRWSCRGGSLALPRLRCGGVIRVESSSARAARVSRWRGPVSGCGRPGSSCCVSGRAPGRDPPLASGCSGHEPPPLSGSGIARVIASIPAGARATSRAAGTARTIFGSTTISLGPPIIRRCSTLSRRTKMSRRRLSTLA
jgi:hypothetical protein